MTISEAKVEDAIHALAPRETIVPAKNVLFATDFSPTSAAAFPYAAAICRRFGATLHAAHVLSDAGLLMIGGVDYVSLGVLYDDAEAEAKKKVEQLCSRLLETPHRTYVRHGPVWKNLDDIIAANGIDLIIVGTHGRTGLGKLLLGSVAEDILRHAHCPVLTVGPKVSGHAKLPAFQNGGHDLAPLELDIRQIVAATNFTSNAALMARAAVSLAQEFRSRLTLMHVIEDYTHLGSRPARLQDGTRRLQQLLPKKTVLPYCPETVLEFGSAQERILKIAAERESDLIVLGARSAGEAGSTHLPWSTAHHVIAHAHCPVLTIRG